MKNEGIRPPLVRSQDRQVMLPGDSYHLDAFFLSSGRLTLERPGRLVIEFAPGGVQTRTYEQGVDAYLATTTRKDLLARWREARKESQ